MGGWVQCGQDLEVNALGCNSSKEVGLSPGGITVVIVLIKSSSVVFISKVG